MNSTRGSFTFSVDFGLWVDSAKVGVIYDDNGKMVGSFTIQDGGLIKCFVSSYNHQLALEVTSGIPFYATPIQSHDGSVESIVISQVPASVTSKSVEAEPYIL